ncbi:3-oxoacyl-reductase [Dichotomocladium elegans]|nr:3-oxoacyl-reductase [Dichotomocladium elegans]
MLPFQNQTALITGATRGIGYAIANAFARQGACTILVGKDPRHVEMAENAFQQAYGEDHKGVVLDVSTKETIDKVMKELLKSYKIDYLVNAAGISRDGLLLRMKESDLHDTMNVNLYGTMHMCQAVAKQMMKQKGGCIINLSSVVGIYGNTGQTAYGASKAGIIGFTKSLAKELGPYQVRVNAIAPGYIETDMTSYMLSTPEKRSALTNMIPLRKLGQPDDVAEAAMFLARSKYMHGAVRKS